MLLNWPTFVIERRVNKPPQVVQAGLQKSDALAVDTHIGLGEIGELQVETPWRPALCWHSLSWRANGRLVNGHGHLVARVEIEVGEWSDDATRLQVRPRASRIQRWTGRHIKRYFALAHNAADQTARRLNNIAVASELDEIRAIVNARAV
jgi:hypothetical protein